MSELNAFVDSVAKDCINNLSETEIKYFVENPDTIGQHMFYGMYIRNKYIHGNEQAQEFADADHLSGIILERILSLLLPDEYEYGDSLTTRLFECKQFRNLRNVYKRKYGEYPIEFIKEAKNHIKKTYDEKYNISYYSQDDIRAYVDTLAEELWNEPFFEENAKEHGIHTDELAVYIENFKKIYQEDGVFIPLQLSYLAVPDKISTDEYNAFVIKLMSIIDKNIIIVKKLNSKFLEDRLVAKVALKCPWAMKYMPMWKIDDELVDYAMKNSAEAIDYIDSHYLENREFLVNAIKKSGEFAIMGLESMSKYRADRELALIACEMNGDNFSYIEETLRDDYEIAKIAIKNARFFSIYEDLGPSLKKDKSLALLECECERPGVEYFIDEFKDDEEIAEKIIRLHGKKSWSLYWMSERIMQKYGIVY